MIKSEAIDYVNKRTNNVLNSRNTIFSNLGSSLDVWWLEPANKKFESGFYFILNNLNKKKLLLFKVPGGVINKSMFRQREEKDASQIIIPISDIEFIDRRRYNFNRFLVEEIQY